MTLPTPTDIRDALQALRDREGGLGRLTISDLFRLLELVADVLIGTDNEEAVNEVDDMV